LAFLRPATHAFKDMLARFRRGTHLGGQCPPAIRIGRSRRTRTYHRIAVSTRWTGATGFFARRRSGVAAALGRPRTAIPLVVTARIRALVEILPFRRPRAI